MANPISTGRRAVLGLSKMKKAPTGNLPTLREPQPTVIERTLDKPVDRRTFLEGARNAATAVSTADKLGALGDIIPTPEINSADKVLGVVKDFAQKSFGRKYLNDSFVFDKLGPWVTEQLFETDAPQMNWMTKIFDDASQTLSTDEKAQALELLTNASRNSEKLKKVEANDDSEYAWDNLYKRWDREPRIDEVIAGHNPAKLPNHPFTTEQIADINSFLDPNIEDRVSNAYELLMDGMFDELTDSNWIIPDEELMRGLD